MEVRAFCIALLIVTILLCAHVEEVDAAFLRISPNRLQFFEYELVTFYCDGVFYCDVEHKSIKEKPSCCTTTNRQSRGPTCTIKNIYQDDSGKYWCEEGIERSNIININVTSGSVILESPALPVMEGEDVTLSCRIKESSSNIQADFYKDGVHKLRSNTGNLNLKPVSMSDQGFYKCNISGVGESPLSVLAVREPHKDSNTGSSSTSWIVSTVLLMLVLLVVGLLRFGRFSFVRNEEHRMNFAQFCFAASRFFHVSKRHDVCSQSMAVPDSEYQTVSVQASAPEASQPMYATVTKTRKKNDENGEPPIYYALGESGDPQLAESSVPSVTPVDNDAYYSTIQDVAKH
ncbi:low affinity immunoglobulin gamma Fc region receptor II-like isoform X2 [Mugil cephalus]|uniref:low affinity immunoglobulin gamma Fc region receptor II-like isoform X2 n=1 Tax=Mugil cephalus TaxID=48193 RepID=UPI001FB69E05|nr:low affinity immunoglobulin gamma Fc region receptor II-like isoform X2 [Mugil cephalus]